jgi:RNA recognition motif-containing protein
MSANTVHVKNISSQTDKKEVEDFFSFCGKVTNLEIAPSGETKSATVTFEKETAAKTALLLDNTQLGSTHVQVTSATGSTEDDGSHYTTNAERDGDEITQEEKPRSRIIAEYLAHGYVVGDVTAQRAIDLDQKHGVSSRFLQTLQNIDSKYHATDKAKSVDQSYGVIRKANSLLSGLTSYYEKAAGTPTGQKLVNFYTQSSRQVQDIHAEARRLANLKKQEAGGAEKAAGLEKAAGTEKTTSTTAPAHDSATAGTSIFGSTKVAPLEPEKGA